MRSPVLIREHRPRAYISAELTAVLVTAAIVIGAIAAGWMW